MLLLTPLASHSASIDLSGEWRFALDPDDRWLDAGPDNPHFDDSISLPNTTARAGKGNPLEINLDLERPAMQHLHQKFSYIGPAWYQRTVEIPEDWGNKNVTLLLERVIWESRVWVNGREAGAEDSLSVPHRHQIGDLLRAGETNTLTVRVDNREKLPNWSFHFGERPAVDAFFRAEGDRTIGEGAFEIESIPLGNAIELGNIRQAL